MPPMALAPPVLSAPPPKLDALPLSAPPAPSTPPLHAPSSHTLCATSSSDLWACAHRSVSHFLISSSAASCSAARSSSSMCTAHSVGFHLGWKACFWLRIWGRILFWLPALLISLSQIQSFHLGLEGSALRGRYCNVLLHLVTVPGNRTHEGLPWHIPTSCGPLIWFVTASHYVIVPTVRIVVDMTHYVIVTTVFPSNTLFCTIAL